MKTIIIEGNDYTPQTCITCGVRFFVPSGLITYQQENGGYHHCPNGHAQGWSKDGCELARVRRERDMLRQQSARKDDELRAAQGSLTTALVDLAKAGKETARLKRRAAGGACPCCNRIFTNMARHMKTKHPEMLSANVVKLNAQQK